MRGRRTIRASATTVAILVAASAGPAPAGTIRVPGDHPTIWQALDAASAGDSVVVAPGVYRASAERTISGTVYRAAGYLRPGVTLRSEAGPLVTAIELPSDPPPTHGFVAAGIPTGALVTVEGLTIREPIAGTLLSEGILFTGSVGCSLEVRDCVFLDIRGEPAGNAAAIATDRGTLLVERCLFERCGGPAYSKSSIRHAGYTSNARVTLRACEFVACDGIVVDVTNAALLCTDSSFRRCLNRIVDVRTSNSVVVSGCRFEDNDAPYGVLYSYHCQVVFEDNLLVGNAASYVPYLSMIYWTSSSGVLRRNTFDRNSLPTGSGYPVVLYVYSGTATLEGNIVAGCTGTVAVRRRAGTAATLVEGCNVYWNNAAGHLDGVAMAPTSRIVDPLWCAAPSRDYRLRDTSPCVPDSSAGCGRIGAFDADCSPRIFVTSTPSPLRVGIDGAAHFTPFQVPPAEWMPGSVHTLFAVTPQDIDSLEVWAFDAWSDGGDTAHVVTVPPGEVEYRAFYGRETNPTTRVRSEPPGRRLLVEGRPYEQETLWRWPRGTIHALEAPSPQPESPGRQWEFVSWSDGGARAHDYVVPATDQEVIAAFDLVGLPGVRLDTQPSGLAIEADSVSYATPVFFAWPAGSQHVVRAPTPQDVVDDPSMLWAFAGWSDGADTTRVVTVPPGHLSLVAAYQKERKIPVTVASIPVGRAVRLDGTTYTAPVTVALVRATTHTLDVPSPQAAGLGKEWRFASWSDGGAQSHAVVIPAAAVTYAATLTLESLQGAVIRTEPASVNLRIDGAWRTTPRFEPWSAGSEHVLLAPSSTMAGGTRYVFLHWEDGSTSATRAYTQPAGHDTVTATYRFDSIGQITVDTVPPELPVRVDDVEYRAPQTLLLPIGSTHVVEADSVIGVDASTRWGFRSWSDGGARRHTITVGSAPRAFVATFGTDYRLTTSVEPAGTVTPATGWFPAGTTFPVLATPSPLFVFWEWVGTGAGSYSGPDNPATIVMNEPIHQHAQFVRRSFEFSLSLSESDPHVHAGPPLGGLGSVHLWVVCGSGEQLRTFRGRVAGTMIPLVFTPAEGVFNNAGWPDLELIVPACVTPPALLGTYTVFDPDGSDLCIMPTVADGRLVATNCDPSAPGSFEWPGDMKVHGVATDGMPWCVAGRACGEEETPIAIRLSGLDAVEVGRAVEVRWTTTLEVRHDGFRVLRADGAPGGYRARHEGLVRGRSPYAWRDDDVAPATTYWYVVDAVDLAGREARHGPARITTSAWGPLVLALEGARPNPVDGRAELRFHLPRSGPARLSLYDVAGRLVARIVDGEFPAGETRLAWQGRDGDGRRLPAGVYFLRLEGAAESRTRRVVLLEPH